jgi:hypothetical protein
METKAEPESRNWFKGLQTTTPKIGTDRPSTYSISFSSEGALHFIEILSFN